MITETIQKLKEVEVFDEFKKSIEIILEETSKPQIDWDINKLNCGGLEYDYNYGWIPEAHIKDRDCVYGCQKCGLSFGCIKWHLYTYAKGPRHFEGFNENDFTKYNEYDNKFSDINFSCFYGKTPQQILDILNEVK